MARPSPWGKKVSLICLHALPAGPVPCMQVCPLHTWVLRGRIGQCSRVSSGRKKGVTTFSSNSNYKIHFSFMTFFWNPLEMSKCVYKMTRESGVSRTLHRRYVCFKFCRHVLAPGQEGVRWGKWTPGRWAEPRAAWEGAGVRPGWGHPGGLPYLIHRGLWCEEGARGGGRAWRPGPGSPPGSASGLSVPAQSSARKQVTELPSVNPQTVFLSFNWKIHLILPPGLVALLHLHIFQNVSSTDQITLMNILDSQTLLNRK